MGAEHVRFRVLRRLHAVVTSSYSFRLETFMLHKDALASRFCDPQHEAPNSKAVSMAPESGFHRYQRYFRMLDFHLF